MFLCSGEVENIRMIKYLLRNFKVVSGIKVNFNKCSLVSLNIERGMQASMAEILCCSLEKLPCSSWACILTSIISWHHRGRVWLIESRGDCKVER